MSRISFIPQDPAFEERARESFRRQTAMAAIGASLISVAPGQVEIHLPYSAQLTQQNGYMHAGIVAMILDSACGYAAMTLTPPGANILTVEYKANFMAPALGDSFVATGRVVKAGKTLIVCQGDVHAQKDGADRAVVVAMLATMMVLRAT